jgi:hypothetical protein
MSVQIKTIIEAKNPETGIWENFENKTLHGEKQANLLAGYIPSNNVYPNMALKQAIGIPEDSPMFKQETDPKTVLESFLTLKEIDQPDYWTHIYFTYEDLETGESKYKASYDEVCKSFLEEVVPKMYGHMMNEMTTEDVRALIYIKESITKYSDNNNK